MLRLGLLQDWNVKVGVFPGAQSGMPMRFTIKLAYVVTEFMPGVIS